MPRPCTQLRQRMAKRLVSAFHCRQQGSAILLPQPTPTLQRFSCNTLSRPLNGENSAAIAGVVGFDGGAMSRQDALRDCETEAGAGVAGRGAAPESSEQVLCGFG